MSYWPKIQDKMTKCSLRIAGQFSKYDTNLVWRQALFDTCEFRDSEGNKMYRIILNADQIWQNTSVYV